MAVTSANRMFETSGDSDEGGDRYTQTWIVITDSRSDDVPDVLAASALPGYGDAHDGDSTAEVVSLSAERDTRNPLVWRVTVEYSTAGNEGSSGGGGGGSGDNPIDWRPKRKWTFGNKTKAIEKAMRLDPSSGYIQAEGVAVTNSVGDKFDPPLEDQYAYLILNYTRNELSFNVSQALDYTNAVNSDTWNGLTAAQAKVLSIEAGDEKKFKSYRYYPVTYVIGMDSDTWDRFPLNQGYRAKDSNGNVFEIPNREKRNLKVSDSTVLSDGATEEFMRYRVKQRAFSALNINL